MTIIGIVAVLFLLFMIFRPDKMKSVSSGSSSKKYYTKDDEFNARRQEKQESIDRILEKIHKKGVNSLTKREKELLDEYSNSN